MRWMLSLTTLVNVIETRTVRTRPTKRTARTQVRKVVRVAVELGIQPMCVLFAIILTGIAIARCHFEQSASSATLKGKGIYSRILPWTKCGDGTEWTAAPPKPANPKATHKQADSSKHLGKFGKKFRKGEQSVSNVLAISEVVKICLVWRWFVVYPTVIIL